MLSGSTASANASTATLVNDKFNAHPRPRLASPITPFSTFRMSIDGTPFKPALAVRASSDETPRNLPTADKKADKKTPRLIVRPPITGLCNMAGMPGIGGAHFLPPPEPEAERKEEERKAKKLAQKQEKEQAKKMKKEKKEMRLPPVALGMGGMGGGPSFEASHFLPAPKVLSSASSTTPSTATAVPATGGTTSGPSPRRSIDSATTLSAPPSYAQARAQTARAIVARGSVEESLENHFQLSALGVGGPVLAYRFPRPTPQPKTRKVKEQPQLKEKVESGEEEEEDNKTLASIKSRAGFKRLFGKR
ncbi:hypothetical protein ACQY0O_006740 [Thecaphora frezii]